MIIWQLRNTVENITMGNDDSCYRYLFQAQNIGFTLKSMPRGSLDNFHVRLIVNEIPVDTLTSSFS